MAFNDQYILGNEFFIYTADTSAATDTPVAFATEATISLSADTIDCASKSSGNWATSIGGQVSWTASTSALYTTTSSFDSLYGKMIGRQPIYIKMARCTIDPSTGEAQPGTKKTGTTYYTGPAFITSLELTAGNGEVASYSAEFTGAGALTSGTV